MNSESMSSPKQNPSFSMDDFAKALEGYEFQFNIGQVVSGKVVQHSLEGVYVDIQAKSLAFLPLREIPVTTASDLAQIIPLDSERDFLIVKEQDAEGQITVSLRQLAMQHAWERLAEVKENGETVEMFVSGTNKGGVTGEIEGLRCFIPRSHLVQKNNLESLVGQSLSANLLEVDPERNKLVLSQRQMARTAAMSELQQGDLVEGKVARIESYGVFVDLNGVTGLLHIKQISNQHIESLFNLFRIGESVKAIIIELDEIKKRISLSTKILEDYPGEIIEKKDQVWETIETRLEKVQRKLSD
ncbi:S1 RNA-binding domain-containing protein [Gloeocapsa sp. PCC 73106]|uniref:S1 RNA-binding domain-containing protein n=1 Tax=Gloeocapsa sp. PCC 73106 TaxID=102232 RepID=UPI00031FB563|nr:S1 RNA-binding domain-containing protein [Gloeocapsa sp. PCC 73106]